MNTTSKQADELAITILIANPNVESFFSSKMALLTPVLRRVRQKTHENYEEWTHRLAYRTAEVGAMRSARP